MVKEPKKLYENEENVFDLEWDEEEYRCADCGCLLDEDDPIHGIDHENYYCEECAENYSRCEYCDSILDDEDYVVYYGGASYCTFCFEEALGGFICPNCGKDCTEDDGEEGEDGERYCYDCLEEIEEEEE